jgi:hypothetical protein
MKRLIGFFALACLAVAPLAAQGTGSITGTVTGPDGSGLPGVTVEATSDVLPQPASTVSMGDGTFRFPFLPPGTYTLKFALEGLAEQQREVRVFLDTNTTVPITLALEGGAEEITVVDTSTMIDPSSAEIRSAISNEEIEAVPVGQDYRDLQKLIPGVQYTELEHRGANAGGSGQDNVYLYDGVMVNLPLFGTLSAEPSTHDVDQMSIIKGGAKALDFNRSSGLTMNTISKSGTNRFHGEVSYKYQPESLRSQSDDPTTDFDENRDWATVGVGGPLVRDHLFFYASYYRPTVDHDEEINAYGSVPGFESTRDEWFGRLSFQPTANLLLHGSYRDSDRDDKHTDIGPFEAASLSIGDKGTLEIGILEGTWTVTGSSFLTFRLTDFESPGGLVPDTVLPFAPAADGSVRLDVANLDTQGRLEVPILRGDPAHDAFVTPFIQRYGFLQNGVRMGGGFVGAASQFDRDDFFRQSWQAGYDWLLGGNVTHDLHFGYQWYRDEEDRDFHSNGWGNIQVLGGRVNAPNGQPVFFRATPLQTGLTGLPGGPAPVIHSELEVQNVEINDTIGWNDWSFNVGVVVSNDELFGQGLRKGGNLPSGFELCITCQYKMYEVDFEDQVQPRLGVVWAYAPEGTVFANYARYHPAASSLPRAASWARNNATIREANFDAAGNLISIQALSSSTGKFFQPDLDPRATDEYLIGASRRLGPRWTGRLTARNRRSYNFWEDTNNNARQFGNAPADIDHSLYIPNLATLQTGIGGSSYVIAELDNSFTKYYEVSPEVEFRTSKANVRASYVWSHYYGNFDQDNTSGDFIDNDTSTFIGSSNLADDPGRQLWDKKYGNLHGDRRHLVKVFGYHRLNWNASVGAFAVYQSGQPWEAWDVEVYRAFTGSASNTIRFAEPAGSNEADDHYRLDLNYTQNFDIGDRFGIGVSADVFNVFDRQTGYAIQPVVSNAAFGEPTEYYDPQRVRLTVRLSY